MPRTLPASIQFVSFPRPTMWSISGSRGCLETRRGKRSHFRGEPMLGETLRFEEGIKAEIFPEVVPDRYRFLASVTAGDSPFPGPLETFRRRFEPQKNAAFVVEFSSISVTARRFSMPAQVATVVSLIAGMLGGLAVFMTFVPYGFADSIRS